jgi:hypothetical protein
MDFDSGVVEFYDPISLAPGEVLTFLESTMTNQTDNPDWPGDPSFLEDKYVRFSYRFKFDDNEYSLFAPFTQITYIPKQKGYFINGDETDAYKSTVINWMENNINNIELLIPMPDKGSLIRDSYKITQLDILYKESDSLAVKVLDSISYEEIETGIYAGVSVYNYPYQSQKPYKTLPEDQLTRVYDNVPTRALAQEIVGNRVIYGNFYNSYTAPQNINYNTAVQPKSDIFTNFVEYPNHTLKQNRNYQVGFILADKFGRQSSVILSTLDLTTVTGGSTSASFGGSTVYAPYQSEDMPGMPDVRNWFGNALLVLINDPISSTRSIPNGTPGLYAEPTAVGGFSILAGATYNVQNPSTNLYEYTFTLNTTSGIINTIPQEGDSLRGKYKDYVKVVAPTTGTGSGPYIVSTDGEISAMYLFDPSLSPTPNTKFAYSINEIGWYSYKVVVKQQQQEYYNVYLPGMLDGYPTGQTYGSQVIYTGVAADPSLENGINMTEFPVGEDGKTGHIVLINDNINKVPRDLVEVGPDQKLYRSSVQLFGKVSNIAKPFSLLADEDFIINNPYETSIRYKIADNLTALQDVRIGDGIQSVEANKPIVNPAYPGATLPNPDEWMANTVVTSNTLLAYECVSDTSTPPGAVSMTVVAPHPIITIGDKFTYEVSGITYDAEVGGYGSNVITFTVLTQPTVTIPSNTFLYFTNPDYGVITFTPPNPTRATGATIYAPYINYIITSAESTQYFPTRQPDTVTAIATATDYNFLANGVTNVKGTAGLNFYQLQTNPSIGRVSTINPIGVPSIDMIPFLGVYETRPVDSLLALFWETASTGYISDLNWDVLTGFDGPTRFSDLGFKFFENQDPLGTNTDPGATGDADCPFITDEFYIENNTGFTIIPLSTPYLFEVKDGNGVTYTSNFLLEEITTGLYRIKITPPSNFVFDRGAITTNTNSSFNFVVRVEWGIPGQFADLSFTGRLGNIAPTFLHEYPYYNAFATQTVTTNVTTVTAVNGTHGTLTQKDLYFDILSGNSGGWFDIDYATGQIDLTDATIPLGVYDLEIRVRDAVTPPAPGNPLIGSGAFQTLSDIIIVRISVGPKPVDNYLQYFQSPEIYENYNDVACGAPPGQGYGAIHVGVDNLALDPVTHINNGLPDITLTTPAATSKAFQNYNNIQIANGVLPPPFGNPTGLTQGALEWEVFVAGQGLEDASITGSTQFILYYRPLMISPNTNTWQPVLDENGVLFPASTKWSAGIETVSPSTPSTVATELRITFPDGSTGGEIKSMSTKFVTSTPGEYCLVIKSTYNETKTGDQVCGPKISSYAIVKDANYEYIEDGEPVITPPFPDPSTVPVEYLTAIKEEWNGDYPAGIPYDTQDATVGFAFSATGTLFAATPATPAVGSNKIQLTTLDPQLVPGVYVVAVGFLSPGTQITDVDSATNTLTLSSPAYANMPTSTAVSFTTMSTSPSKRGSVWASTNNGLHVNQFYVDSALTQAWVPPIADKFYIYQNKNLNYVVSDTPSPITNKPFFCAKIDSNGGVTPIVSPGNTVTTAWKQTALDPLENHGRNLFFTSDSI